MQFPMVINYAPESPLGNRKGQPHQSAMVRPHSGGTAYLITVAPVQVNILFT